MDKAKSFQDLIVWQKSHQFVLAIYKLTKSFPQDELFGLTSQIRRSGWSGQQSAVSNQPKPLFEDLLLTAEC